MALYPKAKHELIPAGANDPAITPRLAILHVAVSVAESIRAIFLGRGGIESHFYINLLGRVYQYRDTGREADANAGANDIAVSIETAGWGHGKWNLLQRRAIKRLLLWLHEVEGIPLEVPASPRGQGVGYHVQFGAPGGWTGVAKSCPGPERIKQYHQWLVPWMRGNPTTKEDWFDMATKTELEDIVRDVVADELRKQRRSDYVNVDRAKDNGWTYGRALSFLVATVHDLTVKVNALTAKPAGDHAGTDKEDC